MKTCIRCKVEKSESEFGRLAKSADGLAYYCKTCNREMVRIRLQDPETKARTRANQAKHRKGEKYKAVKRRYYYSEKGQAAAKRWMEKAKESGKAKARQAINHAVEEGKIPPAADCQCAMFDGVCYGPMEYHHNSYHEKDYLKVVPLCRKHHLAVHDVMCYS